MAPRGLPIRVDETRRERRVIDGREADVYEAIGYRSETTRRHAGSAPPRTALRRRAAISVLLIGGVMIAYFRVIRPWHMHWGAADAEVRGALAGDELMPNAGIVSTRVIEIDAPPSAIWPWLVQMGPGRGGAYTYEWIERRLGVDIHNVDRIVPELQNLAVGDEIPMPGYAMRVEQLEPGRAMVVRATNGAWLWAFELRAGDGHTRLLSRNSFDTSKLQLKDWLAYPVIEPGSWVMERKMLLTIKQRAESLARSRGERATEAEANQTVMPRQRHTD
jgi:hypothetical protein